MGCSYKAGIITIAVITIIFAGFNLSKVARDMHRHHHEHHHGKHGHHHGHPHHEHHHGKHGHHHGHHHPKHHEEGHPFGDDDIAVPEWNDKDEAVPVIAEKRDEDLKDKRMEQPYPTDQDWKTEEENKFGEKDPHKWGNHRSKKIASIVMLVADVISIITSFLIFAVVTEDVGKNQRRRHMILPYIVWHLLCIFLMIVGCIFAMIVFKDYIDALVIPLIIIGVSICISVLFVTIAIKYFNSLGKGAGFAYAQMDDMVKKPLA